MFRMFVLMSIVFLLSCSGGTVVDPGDPVDPVKGKAIVTWSNVSPTAWEIEAQTGWNGWRKLWTGQVGSHGTMTHTFDIAEDQTIRFVYRDGILVNSAIDSVTGPGVYSFTITRKYVN